MPSIGFRHMSSICPLLMLTCVLMGSRLASAEETALTQHWLWSKAHVIPYETTSEQSGYFSIIEGKNHRVYIGTAKYGENAFSPTAKDLGRRIS